MPQILQKAYQVVQGRPDPHTDNVNTSTFQSKPNMWGYLSYQSITSKREILFNTLHIYFSVILLIISFIQSRAIWHT